MPRWEPDARPRLVRAALELFDERGYDATTVAAVTERAGLTRSSFFRHFADKREVLFGEQAHLAELVRAGLAEAPDDLPPLALVRTALARLATGFDGGDRDLAPLRRRIVASTPELRERTVGKRADLADAMTAGLTGRGVPHLEAQVLASLAVLAFARAHEGWADLGEPRPFPTLLTAALDDVLTTAAVAVDGATDGDRPRRRTATRATT